MSSAYVRTNFKDFLIDNAPTENVLDLTADYQDFREFLTENDLQPDAPFLGVQFIGDDEIPISLASTNDQGLYRETGAIYLHIAAIAQLGVGDSLVTRGEILRNLLRGRRIGAIVIERVTPMNFDSGANLQFEAGYMSGSFYMSYYMDLGL